MENGWLSNPCQSLWFLAPKYPPFRAYYNNLYSFLTIPPQETIPANTHTLLTQNNSGNQIRRSFRSGSGSPQDFSYSFCFFHIKATGKIMKWIRKTIKDSLPFHSQPFSFRICIKVCGLITYWMTVIMDYYHMRSAAQRLRQIAPVGFYKSFSHNFLGEESRREKGALPLKLAK